MVKCRTSAPRFAAACACVVLIGGCVFDESGLAGVGAGDAFTPDFEGGIAIVPDAGPPLDVDVPLDVLSDVRPDLLQPDATGPTCNDKVKNGTETDVDCGGDCAACGIGKSCSRHADCRPNGCKGSKCVYLKSCEEIRKAHKNLTNGNYTVGTKAGTTATKCDFSTDGGGWTLIQRTVWTWVGASQFLRTRFSDFYNKNAGALSSAWRAAGKHWSTWNAKRELLLVVQLRKTDGTSCSALRYKTKVATLSVDTKAESFKFSGISTSTILRNEALSTTSSGPNTECSNTKKGVAWFYGSSPCCLVCPTLGGYWPSVPHPMVHANLFSSADLAGNQPSSGCTSSWTTSGSFRGVNVMEFYLR